MTTLDQIKADAIEAADKAYSSRLILEMSNAEPETPMTAIRRNATRASIEAYEAAMWRPISEAPKDGTAVFVYVPATDEEMRYTCVAQYHDGEISWKNDDLNKATLFRPLHQPPSEVK